MRQTENLASQVAGGSKRALARLITLIENDSPAASEPLAALYKQTGRAHLVGVTGAPGSGKSSLVNEIAKELRRQNKTVAIVAVDPSSPYSGGAILGDRIRMRDLAGDSGVFIRSMASRGSLGGLAHKTGDVVKVLDAAGYQVILIETVGAGQAEVDIAGAAHTTLVVEAPGMGDEIQAIKAGILEIADILVVNKADRQGAESTIRALQAMQRLGQTDTAARFHHGRLLDIDLEDNPVESEEKAWDVPILPAVATNGTGVPELVDSIQAHLDYLQRTGELGRERRSGLSASLSSDCSRPCSIVLSGRSVRSVFKRRYRS